MTRGCTCAACSQETAEARGARQTWPLHFRCLRPCSGSYAKQPSDPFAPAASTTSLTPPTPSPPPWPTPTPRCSAPAPTSRLAPSARARSWGAPAAPAARPAATGPVGVKGSGSRAGAGRQGLRSRRKAHPHLQGRPHANRASLPAQQRRRPASVRGRAGRAVATAASSPLPPASSSTRCIA
jgi:hypothetical protein